MISFACKKIEISEIVRCGFSLTKSAYVVFNFLLQNKGTFDIFVLSDKLSLERSTIQKALKILHIRDLVVKHQKNLSQGGYKYTYSLKNKTRIKTKLLSIIEEWHSQVKISVNKL